MLGVGGERVGIVAERGDLHARLRHQFAHVGGPGGVEGGDVEVRDAGVGISLWRDRFSQPLMVLMAAVGLALRSASETKSDCDAARFVLFDLVVARGEVRSKGAAE